MCFKHIVKIYHQQHGALNHLASPRHYTCHANAQTQNIEEWTRAWFFFPANPPFFFKFYFSHPLKWNLCKLIFWNSHSQKKFFLRIVLIKKRISRVSLGWTTCLLLFLELQVIRAITTIEKTTPGTGPSVTSLGNTVLRQLTMGPLHCITGNSIWAKLTCSKWEQQAQHTFWFCRAQQQNCLLSVLHTASEPAQSGKLLTKNLHYEP